jgi:hypothetical protein
MRVGLLYDYLTACFRYAEAVTVDNMSLNSSCNSILLPWPPVEAEWLGVDFGLSLERGNQEERLVLLVLLRGICHWSHDGSALRSVSTR